MTCRFRPTSYVLALILAAAGPSCRLSRGLPETAPLRTADPAPRIEARVPELMAEALIPGLSMATIRNGRLDRTFAFGVMNAETAEAVRDDTVFEAASLSKPVFAYGVMKLVDEGRLDLDRPLSEYADEAALQTAYPAVQGGDPRYKKITARMVLTHSTGFPNWFGAGRMRFLFDPGERFSYSGEAYSYLAAVVEKITGLGFVDFMNRTVLEPLGMKDSSYIWLERYDRQFASSHNAVGARTNRGHALTPRPGASLYTTASDYGRFLAALLNGTGLSRRILDEMLRPQIEVKSGPDKVFVFPWGLGIGLNGGDGNPSFWHWGDNGEFMAYFEVLRKEKKGLVVFMNSPNGQAITPALSRELLGLDRPAIATIYFDYPPYDSPTIRFYKAYRTSGPEDLARRAAAILEDPDLKNSPAVRAIQNLAGLAFGQGRLPAAQALAETFLKFQPKSQPMAVLLAGISIWEGDRAGMNKRLDDAHKDFPNLENAINGLGYTLLRADKIDAAVAVLEYNANRYPASANVWDSLAEAWEKKGDAAKAVQYYEKALAVDPKLESALTALKRLKGAAAGVGST